MVARVARAWPGHGVRGNSTAPMPGGAGVKRTGAALGGNVEADALTAAGALHDRVRGGRLGQGQHASDLGMPKTGSPTRKRVTPSPSAATVPPGPSRGWREALDPEAVHDDG